MGMSNIHSSMHPPVHPDGALGNSLLVSKPNQSQETGGNEAISCLWSWYLIQMLLCVDSQWVLIKLRVRVVTSGTPCMDLVRKTTVIFTDCQLGLGTTCFQTTFTEIVQKMHLLLWNPPIFYGSWYKGPTRYVKWRADGEHVYQQKTQNHELGLFWTGENDMVVFQCTDPSMSRDVRETMAGNMGEINCNQTGPRDCAAFVFPGHFYSSVYLYFVSFSNIFPWSSRWCSSNILEPTTFRFV